MRVTRVQRTRIREPAPVETRGHAYPWVLTRRLNGTKTDLSCWVMHTGDCPALADLIDQGAETQIHLADQDLARTMYMNRANRGCDVCKPGILLGEVFPDDTKLAVLRARRGGA